jgi:hemoglobin
MSDRPSIYEFVGGADTFLRLTETFYAKVRVDPLLAGLFAEFTPDHIENVASWLGEVFGGPDDYSAKHDGHRGVLTHHLRLNISEAQRARWAELMLAAADEVLPDDERLRHRFAEYIEWGTAIARDVSRPGADIGTPGPVPHWDW